MKSNGSAKLSVGANLISFLMTSLSISEKEVVCHLYDLAQESLNKVREVTSSATWASKIVSMPGSSLKLRVKAKYEHVYKNVKLGNIIVTFDLSKGKKRIYQEQDVLNFQTEEILLGK